MDNKWQCSPYIWFTHKVQTTDTKTNSTGWVSGKFTLISELLIPQENKMTKLEKEDFSTNTEYADIDTNC